MKRLSLSGIVAVASGLFSLTLSAAGFVTGDYKGSLKLGEGNELPLVFHFDDTSFSMDSPKQGAFRIPGERIHVSSDSVKVAISSLGASYSGRVVNDTIKGVFTQGIYSFPLELIKSADALARPQTPVPPFPYKTEEVTFPSSGKDATLSGTLTLPANFDPTATPVAVMVTGSGLQNRDEEIFGHRPFAVIADYLARKGIATLRYDDRGFGKSTGDAAIATTRDFADDAIGAIRYLRSEGFRNVGLIGHSEGAQIAFILGASEQKESRPSFIVAMAPPAMRGDSILVFQTDIALRRQGVPDSFRNTYCDILRQVYNAKVSVGNTEAGKTADTLIAASGCSAEEKSFMIRNIGEILSLDNPWLNYFIAYNPEEEIRGTNVPAMAFFGSLDTQVETSSNASSLRRINNPHISIKTYEGRNHLFQTARTGEVEEYGEITETISPEVLDDIVTFISSIR